MADSPLAPKPPATGTEPRWTQPEVAWPLAVAAGFGGAWVGIQTTIPGLPAVLAGLAFTPLFMPLLERGRRGLAALCALGWAVGVGGAVVGSVLEGSFDAVARALPGALAWTEGEVAGLASGSSARSGGASLALTAGVLAGAALLARPAVGLLALPALAHAVAVVACAAGWFAERAVAGGAAPVTAALAGVAPHAALELAGALMLAVALAEPGAVLPPSALVSGRRRLMAGGIALEAFGLGVQLLLRGTWGQSLAGWLR